MPKMKTKKALAKRVKRRKSGSLKRAHANTGHLFGNKPTKRKRHARKATTVHKSDLKRYDHLLPK